MKSIALAALLLVSFASANVFAAGSAADPGEAGVREAEDGWSRAFVTGDAAFLGELLDPAYVSVGPNGKARPKADIIALARDYAAGHPDTQATSLPPTSRIEVKGSAAVVTHHGANDTSVDVFYYSQGRWRAWYSQHTATAPAK